jgi:hypothetical protein
LPPAFSALNDFGHRVTADVEYNAHADLRHWKPNNGHLRLMPTLAGVIDVTG